MIAKNYLPKTNANEEWICLCFFEMKYFFRYQEKNSIFFAFHNIPLSFNLNRLNPLYENKRNKSIAWP